MENGNNIQERERGKEAEATMRSELRGETPDIKSPAHVRTHTGYRILELDPGCGRGKKTCAFLAREGWEEKFCRNTHNT